MEERAEGARLVVGLGNPGARYAGTRHNVGFRVVGELARRRGLAFDSEACRSLVASSPPLWLACPLTYMNRSGYAVRCLTETFGFEATELLVVYDEVQLPFGRLRLRPAGSPGGHRGLESIVEQLTTDRVPRLRVGIQEEGGPPPGEALVDFVLSPFTEDAEEVGELVGRAADACEAWIEEGVEVAMNRFNG